MKCDKITREYSLNKDKKFHRLKGELEKLRNNNFEKVKNDIIFKIIASNQKIIV